LNCIRRCLGGAHTTNGHLSGDGLYNFSDLSNAEASLREGPGNIRHSLCGDDGSLCRRLDGVFEGVYRSPRGCLRRSGAAVFGGRGHSFRDGHGIATGG
jgi:hypothetical protein